MRSFILLLLAATAPLAAAGPLSKFDTKAVVADYVTAKPLEDVERCLIDMDGMLAPLVFRQPDRPGEVRLLWLGTNRIAVGRIDLTRSGSGTRLKSWFPAKQVDGCAPR